MLNFKEKLIRKVKIVFYLKVQVTVKLQFIAKTTGCKSRDTE